MVHVNRPTTPLHRPFSAAQERQGQVPFQAVRGDWLERMVCLSGLPNKKSAELSRKYKKSQSCRIRDLLSNIVALGQKRYSMRSILRCLDVTCMFFYQLCKKRNAAGPV